MAGMTHSGEESKAPQQYGVLFYLGAGGLLTAMVIEAIAVAGRQIGVPLLGALEIIQTAILLAASAAMLSATLADAHASVRLLVERLPPTAQSLLHRLALLVSSLLFASLALAAGWLTADAWSDFEHSELLHIPYRPLRVIVVIMTSAIAIVFAWKAFKPAGSDRK